jgi:hypothetical protein
MSQPQHTRGMAAIAVAALAASLSVGLVACGAIVTGAPAAGQRDSSAQATSGTGTPTTTRDAAPGSESVRLLLGKPSYSATDTITVTIRNVRATAITAIGQHTSCTPLALERSVGGSWQPQGDCLSLGPSQVLEIGPGASVAQSLPPSTDRGPAPSWPAGVYRVTLEYSESATTPGGPISTVSSAHFSIG